MNSTNCDIAFVKAMYESYLAMQTLLKIAVKKIIVVINHLWYGVKAIMSVKKLNTIS